MADFTVTISNSIRPLEEATLWGTAEWGTSFWGYGSETIALAADKSLEESLQLSDSFVSEGGYNAVISNSILTAFEMINGNLVDASGYNYVFTGPSTNADQRNETSFTIITDGTTTWAPASSTTTTWSES